MKKTTNENQTVEFNKEALETAITKMVNAFTAERRKEEPYKEMFKAGSTFTGLLRRLDHECKGHILDAFDVYDNELNGDGKSNEAYQFMMAVPYLVHQLEKYIEKNEGSACCVDKAFFLLSEELKRITEKKDDQ